MIRWDFVHFLMCRRIGKSSAMLGVPSMDLGFFLGNRLDMVSVSVLTSSVILGFCFEGHCAEKKLVRARKVLMIMAVLILIFLAEGMM